MWEPKGFFAMQSVMAPPFGLFSHYFIHICVNNGVMFLILLCNLLLLMYILVLFLLFIEKQLLIYEKIIYHFFYFTCHSVWRF